MSGSVLEVSEVEEWHGVFMTVRRRHRQYITGCCKGIRCVSGMTETIEWVTVKGAPSVAHHPAGLSQLLLCSQLGKVWLMAFEQLVSLTVLSACLGWQ